MPVVNVTCANDRRKLALIPAGCQVVVRNPGGSYVEFFCFHCRAYQTMEIGEHLVGPLRDIGVKLIILDVPDEATETHMARLMTLAEVNAAIAELYAMEELVMPAPRRALWRR